MNELDKKVADIKENFDKPRSAKVTEAYHEKSKEVKRLSSKIRRRKDESHRAELLSTLKKCKQDLRKIPYTPQDNKRLVYIRYADDWLIGICGNKTDCEEIKEEIGTYLKETLKLELSEEKTLITHSSERTRFLGYDISVRRSQVVKGCKNGRKVRTLNHTVELLIPLEEKIDKFLFEKGAVMQTPDGRIKTIHRSQFLNYSDHEIVKLYNAEIRGICNYYRLAVNYHMLNQFCYLMEYSCLKTIASKHKTTISKIWSKYRLGKKWSVPYMTKTGTKQVRIVKTVDCKKGPVYDTISRYIPFLRRTTIQERLNAHICELCKDKNAESYEIHVGSLKNLGNSRWEEVMKKKRRKTLVVCGNCHSNVIHG